MQVAIRSSLEGDTAGIVTMPQPDLRIGVLVAGLLEQDWVTPSIDGPGFEEMVTAFELDWKYLVGFLKKRSARSSRRRLGSFTSEPLELTVEIRVVNTGWIGPLICWGQFN